MKGLITEASPLNFPEGASVDEENFVLDRDGSRARRLGLEYENYYAHVELGSSISSVAVQNYLWQNVDEVPGTSFWVHQFGNKLYFHHIDNTSRGYTGTILFNGPVTLTATTNALFSFASLQGDLIVAVGDQTLRSFRVSQDASGTYSISVAYGRLTVRDFWGVDDGYAIDERPSATQSSTQGALHAYNLYNQGWPWKFFCYNGGEYDNTMDGGTFMDPLSLTRAQIGGFPSNADIISTAMTFVQNGRKAYFPYSLRNINGGNTPAAKGHYIIDLFDRSQGRKDAYTEDANKGQERFDYRSYIPTDQSTGGIKAIAAYAGRIFYACSPGEVGGDSRSPHVGTFVLFSQLADSNTDLTKCYQEADPTAEDISDLIDTDGGYIQLPDAVNIKALIPFRASLLVFADNGVWEIAGGDRGFTATEYQSKFLTNNGAISAQSIVVTPDAVVYWSRNGIYMLGVQQGGMVGIQSISEMTIQTLYNEIPYNSKKYAVGYYDDVAYRLRWLYQDEFEEAFPHRYTHELILDLSMPAWSRFHYKDLDLSVSGIVSPRISGYIELPIYARDNAGTSFKYSTLVQENDGDFYVIPSYCWRRNFTDWFQRDGSATSTASRGADAAAYLVTGYIV